MGHHGKWSIWANNPIAKSWMRNTIMYYSCVLDPKDWDSALVFDGEQGELVKMAIPHARSLVRQYISILTKNKMDFKALTNHQDYQTLNDLKIADSLCKHIVETQNLNRKRAIVAELMMIHGMAFIKTCWRTDLGKEYAEENSSVLFDGDIYTSVHSIFDMFYDFSIEDDSAHVWMECRTIKDRWDLIAQHPELEEEIKALPSSSSNTGFVTDSTSIGHEDNVYIYEVYHKATPSLPSGRMLVYGDEKTVLYDGPNPYGDIPISIVKPEPIHGMGLGFGYPFLSNLLPAQEMLDHEYSAIATNHSACLVQNIAVPRGADISVEELSGMNFFSYTPVPNAQGGGLPTAVNLTQTPNEAFVMIDKLTNMMTQISNISPALRGEPPPGVTSGTAIATLSANALQFIDSAQETLDSGFERAIYFGILSYSLFVKNPRDFMVTTGSKSMAKKFVGENLKAVAKVKIEKINPILNTLAGRLDTAEKAIQNGFVRNIREYLSILDGAPLSVLSDTEQCQLDLIHKENEDLSNGQEVIAMATDDHAMHIMEHTKPINDPETRRNGNVVEKTLAHINEHLMLAKNTDPALLYMAQTGKIPEGGFPPPQQPLGNPEQLGQQSLPQEEAQQQQAAQPSLPAEDLLGRG